MIKSSSQVDNNIANTICVASILNPVKGKSYIAQKYQGVISKINLDVPLLILLLTIASLSFALLYSASGGSSFIIQKHIAHYAVGFLLMLCLAQVRVIKFARLADKLYIVAILLLCVVLLYSDIKGSSRWIDLYFFKIQPSEFIKIILPLFIASLASKHVLPISTKTVLISCAVIILPAALIYLQPDLGTTIIILISGFSILFFAGISWKIMAAVGIVAGISIPIAWQFFLHSYQKKRVLVFLNPENDPFGSGWNILQSQTAIGSGGISGKGWMQGTQAQLDFLPESHTDFIFAVLAEEAGMMGVIILFSLYMLVIFRCCYIAANSNTLFERLFISGFTFVFFIYVFINIGMTSGLLPVVGVPLPLVSYGGSAIVSLLASFGMIMAAHARHNRQITRS